MVPGISRPGLSDDERIADMARLSDGAVILYATRPEPLADHRAEGGRAVLPLATRNYDLIFGIGQPLYRTAPAASWVGGGGSRCAYGCRLAIATSYAGVEPELLEHLITADNIDLHLALRQLRDPTLAGFSNAEPLGTANEAVDSEANVVLEHVFTLHWNQATTPAE